ncbi:MAG: RnfABCDGE type electron transport complex subunit D [Deferribacteres bacterium]|nr:RnfABCDGE type electron transport complex subunit D [candidate division KSB1 bacterium]MCB9500685.1 RnfABCDGE type electron transport complex subunit D [Deferribacteres bacterium]
MNVLNKPLEIRTSPHLKSAVSTDQIMMNVVIALVPTTVFAIYAFGLAALLILSVTTISAVLTEHIYCRLNNKESTISDWSAVITGLLLGLTLPPALPLWMAALGGIASIAVVKLLFGGLGYNIFNPALGGRAILQAAFPVAITTWHPAFLADRFTNIPSSSLAWPFTTPAYDAVASATPLGNMKFNHIATDVTDMVMGLTSGSVGETSAALILLGGLYLVARNMMSWKIPVIIFLTVAVFSGIVHFFNPATPTPQFMLFSGGMMLGAVFMATDMVSSPVTEKGVIVYSIIIGIMVTVIRLWGGLPEGMMYAILMGNAVTPLLNRSLKSRVYGTGRKGGAK